MGGDLVLHLHRLDYADQVALVHLGALGDRDFEDRALERRGQRLARGRGTAGGGPVTFRRLAPVHGRGRGAAYGLADYLDVEELARDLDLVVTGDDLGTLL